MRVVMSLLLHLTAFAVGALVLATYAEPALHDALAQFLLQPNSYLVVGGVAIIFVLCPLAIMLRWWQVFRRAREISYTTENGKISVSLIAIEEALTRAIEGEAEVKKATVRVFEDRVKRSIVIEAVVTLWEVSNVTERNRFCQRLLRRRFAELMPEQTVVQVNLTVHRLNQRRVEVRPARAPSTALASVDGGEAASAAAGQDEAPPLGRNEPAAYISPPPDAIYATSDEDLYVGPTYPVVRDDEEEGGSGTQSYFAKPSPTASVKGGAGKKR
jgi:hypothetical protein